MLFPIIELDFEIGEMSTNVELIISTLSSTLWYSPDPLPVLPKKPEA